MRMALELGMSELIYMRKTKAQLRALRRIAKNIADIPSDVEFHTYLMKMSGNHCVDEFQAIMLEFFKYPKEHDQVFWQEMQNEHLQLCDVLEHGTAMDFYVAMRKHFRTYFNRIPTSNQPKKEDPE